MHDRVCSSCQRPIDHAEASDWCSECTDLAYELRIPIDAFLRRVWIPERPTHPEWELVGILQTGIVVLPVPWPVYVMQPQDLGRTETPTVIPGKVMQVRLSRASYTGKDGSGTLKAELRWTPASGYQLGVIGLHEPYTDGHLKSALKAAHFLWERLRPATGGRPTGTGMFAEETTESMRERILATMRSQLRSRRAISQPAIAAAFNCSEETLRTTLKALGLQGSVWTAMQNEARQS